MLLVEKLAPMIVLQAEKNNVLVKMDIGLAGIMMQILVWNGALKQIAVVVTFVLIMDNAL